MKYRTIHAVIATAGLILAPPILAEKGASLAPITAQVSPGQPAPGNPTGIQIPLEVEDKPLVATPTGKLSMRSAWLGIATEDVSPVLAAQLGRKNTRGAVVTAIVPDSPAAKAGLEKHDIIIAVEEFELMSPRELTEFMAGKKPGETLSIKFLRGGKETVVEAKLAENPAGPKIVKRNVRPGRDSSIFDRADPADVFRRGNHDPFAMLDRMQKEMEQMQEDMRKRFEHSFNFQMGPNSMTQIMRSNGTATLTDNEGSITVEMKDGKKNVRAVDSEGKVLFEGPANTEEEMSKMPDSVRERFENFDADPFDFKHLDGFDRFDDFFRFDVDPPKYRAPEVEVQKDFRRIKKKQKEDAPGDEE